MNIYRHKHFIMQFLLFIGLTIVTINEMVLSKTLSIFLYILILSAKIRSFTKYYKKRCVCAFYDASAFLCGRVLIYVHKI